MTQQGFSALLVIVGVLVVTGLVAGAYYLGTRSTQLRPTLPAEQMGLVKGKVYFTGLPCPPQLSSHHVPPCNGPYSGYIVKVYIVNTASVAADVTTNADGSYLIQLSKGTYLINAQNGPLTKDVQSHQFTITPGHTTTLNLTVDNGMR